MKSTPRYILMFTLINIVSVSILYAPKASEPSKGKTMTETKPHTGQTIDLSTFTKHSSGLLYQVLAGSEKAAKPYAGETVSVHYTGWLFDGTKLGKKFDSSVDRGQKFEFVLGIGQVIKGWDIAVAHMTIGSRILVIIPTNLGYGARGAGAVIPPNATLAFEIELFGAR
jgi:peptidylprolyl isomerase